MENLFTIILFFLGIALIAVSLEVIKAVFFTIYDDEEV